MKRRNEGPLLNTVNILYKLLFGVLILLIFSTMAEQKPIDGVKPKAEYIIEVDWTNTDDNDIDTLFESPTGDLINYLHRSSGFYTLERDDRGKSTDTIALPNGQTKVVLINQEILTMRGTTPGTYHLNIYFYTKRDPGPEHVHVKITKLNPYSVVFQRDLVLNDVGEEQTVANFTIDEKGNFVTFDTLYFSLRQVMGIK